MIHEQDSSFLDELISKVSPAYEIFRGTAVEGKIAAGALVDLLVAEKLRVPANFAQGSALGEDALVAWARSVEGAKPYRNAMQLVLDRFPDWWTATDAAGKSSLTEHLPHLAPAIADVGDGGVNALLKVGDAAFGAAAAYSLANAEAVRAVVSIARAGPADRERCSAVLNKLVEAFPLKMIEDSRDAERLLPALGKTVEASGNGWAEAVELATLLVTNDPSSAYGVLEALPKSLAGATADKQEYLRQFVSLVAALGNRCSGVCLKRLPHSAQAPAAVERALHLASLYGVQAAERHLEASL